jgi:hypothetical protein
MAFPETNCETQKTKKAALRWQRGFLQFNPRDGWAGKVFATFSWRCAAQRRTGIRITDFGNALNNFDYTGEHRQHSRQPNRFRRKIFFSSAK